MTLLDVLFRSPCSAILCAPQPPYAIARLNDTAARWLMRDATSANGVALEAALGEAAPAEWLTALDRAARRNESIRVDDFALDWPDGRSHNGTLLCIPIPEPQSDAPGALLTLIFDESQLSLKPLSVDAVAARLDRTQETLALLPMAAWLFDPRGKLRYVNDAALRLFDVDSLDEFADLVGGTVVEQTLRLRPRMTSASTIAKVTEKSMSTFTPERYRQDATEPSWASDRRREQAEALRRDELAVSRALKKHTIKEQLISVQHPRDDVEMILATSAAPVMDSGGHIAGAVLFTENVTNQMLIDGQRDAILAMAGHDLRNPLTPAKALLQQLRMRLTRDGNFPKEIGYVDRVLEQLLRIESIAADLDAVAANGRGDVTAAMASADLVQLCEEVARKQMERNDTIPVVVRANTTPINGVFSKKHLERALAMLVDSAARRSPPGRQVTIRLKQLRSEVRVEIADAGEPFTPERLEALRAVLRRGGAALAMAHGGDLDLSTIQTILGLYRSRLHVESKPRQGNTFWFEMPAPLPEPEELF